MRAPISLLLLLVLPLAGCARSKPPVVPASPAPVIAPVPVPMPRPPANAAANLSLPERLADGSFATPNHGLAGAAAIWHLRSALNVAVLTCTAAPALAAGYNQLLSMHRAELARAHATLAADLGREMDVAMTRLYNYFAQPPVQAAFCPVASQVLAEAVAVPAGAFAGFAGEALPQLDAPFIAFYRAYDSYRTDLALWREGQLPAAAPRLAYDSRQFMTDDALVGGEAARIVASR